MMLNFLHNLTICFFKLKRVNHFEDFSSDIISNELANKQNSVETL